MFNLPVRFVKNLCGGALLVSALFVVTFAAVPQAAQAASCNRLVLSGPSSIVVNQTSAAFTVQASDSVMSVSNCTLASGGVVTLSDGSANGTFYSDAAGTNPITSVTLSNVGPSDTSHSATFYYKDSATGNRTITATVSFDSNGDTQVVNVTPVMDGAGAMTVNPTTATSGSTGNYVFHFTNNSGANFSSNSQLTLTIPSGWSAPQKTTSGNAGYVTVANSSCSNNPQNGTNDITISGNTITINIEDCDNNDAFDLQYNNVVAPAANTYTFTTATRDGSTGSANIASSPVVTVHAAAPQPPTCPAYTPVAGNNISNPSLETGFTHGPITPETINNGWTANGFGTNNAAFSIVAGHSGSNCNAAQVTITDHTSGDAKWVHTAVAVTAGQNYTFSDWYKSDVPTFVYLYYIPTGGNPANPIVVLANQVPAAASWTQFSHNILAAHTGVLIVAHVLQSEGTLVTDDYALVQVTPSVFDQGIVTLTFDDGWSSTYRSIMEGGVLGNYKSTHYIYSDGMLQVHGPSFANSTQVKTMFDAGHEIGGHSKTHANLTGSGVNLNTEINGNKTDLENVIGAGNLKTFAYPFGAYNSNVVAAVQAAGYDAARTVEQNYNTASTDKFLLKIQHVNSATDIDDIKGWVDTALAQKTWLILMFHEVIDPATENCLGIVPPGGIGECSPRSLLQQMTAYLAEEQACVLTVAEVIANTPCSPTPPPVDTVPPVITTPGNLSVIATSSTSIGATVTFSVSATDANPANPVVTCNPASGSTFSLGSTTVTCTAKDAANNHATSTFVVGVVAPPASNGAPTATAQSITLNENTSVAITLSGTDADNDVLTFATTSNPAHGTLSGVVPNLTYTPVADFVGSDSFNFIVGDGKATSTATITITVNDVPPPPAPTSSGGGGGGGGGVVLGLIGTVNTNPTGGQVLGAATQILTNAQIEAILSLLRSFNADQSVIDNVSKTLRGQVAGASTGKFVFTKTLMMGSTGSDVMELQKRLIAEGFLKITTPTTYFGLLTKAAVMAYQAKYGLPQVGIVGPKTRAQLNK